MRIVNPLILFLLTLTITKKQFFSIFFFSFIGFKSFSQSTTVAAGGQIEGSDGSVSYSVGQFDYGSITSAGGIVIEGIQQPYSSSTLPVTLLQFTALTTDKKDVVLKWTTLSEYNIKTFTVERSKDGLSFKKLSSQQSLGNAITQQNYQTVDASPFEGISYYRLRQTDLNGKEIVSNTVAVTIKSEDASISAFPNPTTTVLHLKVNTASSGQLAFTITTLDGKHIMQQKITADNTIINTSMLLSGTYILKVSRKNALVQSFKIIKN